MTAGIELRLGSDGVQFQGCEQAISWRMRCRKESLRMVDFRQFSGVFLADGIKIAPVAVALGIQSEHQLWSYLSIFETCGVSPKFLQFLTHNTINYFAFQTYYSRSCPAYSHGNASLSQSAPTQTERGASLRFVLHRHRLSVDIDVNPIDVNRLSKAANGFECRAGQHRRAGQSRDEDEKRCRKRSKPSNVWHILVPFRNPLLSRLCQ